LEPQFLFGNRGCFFSLLTYPDLKAFGLGLRLSGTFIFAKLCANMNVPDKIGK
jgi:hypothetical protein